MAPLSHLEICPDSASVHFVFGFWQTPVVGYQIFHLQTKQGSHKAPLSLMNWEIQEASIIESYKYPEWRCPFKLIS